MSEGKGGGPEFEAPKPSPAGREPSKPTETGTGSVSDPEKTVIPEMTPISPVDFDPSVLGALERVVAAGAGSDRLAEIVGKATEKPVPPEVSKAEVGEVVELEHPGGGKFTLDPEHAMTEEPGVVVASVTRELANPREATDFMRAPDTLDSLDREVLQTVRRLGLWEQNTRAYKDSGAGRRELERLQQELIDIQERRRTRAIDTVGDDRREMQRTESVVDREVAAGRLNNDEVNMIISDLRIPERERHAAAEPGLMTMTVAWLNREITDLQDEIADVEAGRSAGDLPALRRELNSARFARGSQLVAEPRNVDVRAFVTATNRYLETLEERRRSNAREVEAGLPFDTSADFGAAVRVIESGTASGAEIAVARDVVNSYFREANRRGYFDRFRRVIGVPLEERRAEIWATTRRGLRLNPAQAGAYQANIDGMIAGSANYIRDFVAAGRADGSRPDTLDVGWDRFGGVMELWLTRTRDYVGQFQTTSRPETTYDAEFTITPTGRGWHISEYGTPVVDENLRTPEEFEECMYSFVIDYLISGAVDRSPQKLFQQAEQFSNIFQSRAVEHHPPELAAQWKHQLRALVGTYAACYFGLLANTPNMEAALTETFREADGIDVLPAAFQAMDAQVGLALRTMNRLRKFRPLHRYSGDNGGIATNVATNARGEESLAAGEMEYIVRDTTEYLVAEEICIYNLTDADYGGSTRGDRTPEKKAANMQKIPLYQTTTQFMTNFDIDTRAQRIRNDVRAGRDISADDRVYYGERMRRALRAVEFARRIESAIGDRALKASPSLIVKVVVRDEQGRPIDRTGRVITVVSDRSLEGTAAKLKRKLKRGAPPSDEKRLSGEPIVERVDFLDENESSRHMQFADSVGRILAQRENGTDEARSGSLTTYQVAERARQFRNNAARELYERGYGARLLDHHGDELYFNIRRHTPGDAFQDGTLVDIDSARSRGEFRLQCMRRMFRGGDLAMYAKLSHADKARVEAEIDADIAAAGMKPLDFDQTTTHVMSYWNNQMYLSLQHEIRSELLSPEVRRDALRIRRGEVLPEDVNMLASLLLQIDPTLTRLRPVRLGAGPDQNIRIINAQVTECSSRHFRNLSELSRQFTNKITGAIGSYYGIPNEPFSWKELLWSADKLNREADRFARRGGPMIKGSPVKAAAFSESFGGDLLFAIGVVSRRDPFERKYSKEITDSNVKAGWIARLNKAFAVLVRFAKGGKLGDENVVPLNLKPLDDFDSMVGVSMTEAYGSHRGEHHFYEGLRKSTGRLKNTLGAIEEQGNVTGESGAIYAETADIRFVRMEHGRRVYIYPKADSSNLVYDWAEIRFMKNGKPDKDTRSHASETGEEWRRMDQQIVTTDIGQGAHDAYAFYEGDYLPYVHNKAREDYEDDQWAIDVADTLHAWRWLGTKYINAAGSR